MNPWSAVLPDLRPSLKATSALLKGRAPKQLVIQFTDSCNARCPQCGMRADNHFERSKLDRRFVREVLKTASENGTMSVSLTGGEPMLFADQVFELLSYARSLGIRYTRTGTNGFMFGQNSSPDFAVHVAKLAMNIKQAQVHTFWISLDSADPAVHEQARGLPGVVAGIRRALVIFRDYGIYPAVNLGINRNMGKTPIEPLTNPELFKKQTRAALRDFYSFVIELGFTTANVCYPMDFHSDSPSAAYYATSTDPMVSFTPQERALLFRVIAQVTEEFRPEIRAFSPLSSLLTLSSQHAHNGTQIAPCRGGVDFFYLSAQGGYLYPCGFRGTEPLGDPTRSITWATDDKPECVSCDWECFRDPSVLSAPLIQFVRRPDLAVRWARNDAPFAEAWWRDWRYYSACDYFSCSKPPNMQRLARFG